MFATLRKQNGLTQAKTAKLLGVSLITVKRYDKRSPCYAVDLLKLKLKGAK